jgi:phenylpyruvate tautomerase PptA (4-oxalocrotonate tautomerase family)
LLVSGFVARNIDIEDAVKKTIAQERKKKESKDNIASLISELTSKSMRTAKND